MNVLFINFNLGSTVGINHGLAVLSSVLKKKGCNVEMLFLCEEMGYGFDLERMERDIVNFAPDVIGLSIMEPQFKYAVDFCRNLIRYFRGFVICGGPHPTMDPETVLMTDGVDAVCIGEGEDALAELVDALQRNEDHKHIKNLWVKMHDGSVVRNKLRPFKNISELPPEDKEIFQLDKLLPHKNYQLEMLMGRGCAYRCSYCINDSYVSNYKKLCHEPVSIKDYIRVRSVNSIIEEIKETIVKYPQIKKVSFIDDNFLMYSAQGNFTEEICKRYKKDIGIPFLCNINPMSFTKAKGKALQDAGCEVIRFGIESGSERIKKEVMKRLITNESVINAFKLAKEIGLMTSSYNMIGLPSETKEEVFKTLELNASILPDSVKVMTFYPFKHTPIYDLCVELDLINHEKKEELDDYDTDTCLNFPREHQFFLKKIQVAFNWYMNVFIDNKAVPHYRDLISRIEAMNEAEWDNYDFDAADREISNKLKKDNIVHYVKFLNRSLAVRFPSKQMYSYLKHI